MAEREPLNAEQLNSLIRQVRDELRTREERRHGPIHDLPLRDRLLHNVKSSKDEIALYFFLKGLRVANGEMSPQIVLPPYIWTKPLDVVEFKAESENTI